MPESLANWLSSPLLLACPFAGLNEIYDMKQNLLLVEDMLSCACYRLLKTHK